MTRDEVIAKLKNTAWLGSNDDREATEEAVSMAIEALQQITCKDCRHKYEEGDCTHYYWCRLHDLPVDDDNYCCWAERRK